ncbi:carboxylesterase family protein [Massilia sp. Dwa41.01b]|uniref:carboxylesterase/lipase family protein n=1 Tax=unclassified Massilia TaxID=2609279 RepID=UPI0016020CDD|nr:MULTISPECIES: carboxylesterase family protein [unclassified Massilia]QNA90609.1 carboxylesterase family protein [Massilia sp. Dwa41.01b]
MLLLAGCGGSDSGPQRALDVVQTAGGEVKAVDRLGMRSYFAIPFAAPPVGELRWKAPAPAQKWTTALANTRSAAPCLQTSASPFRLGGDSEDCLYLDVHAPTGAGPFPVMVNLHGGAFNTGGTMVYADPSPLVSKGVIVVNVAYRLGAMGFLAHPALASEGAAGNYGIMDQQAALKWVQENITAFAGDKNNVTIFGESAGGFSVMTHLASPGSRGLFSKAMVQSGNYGNDRQLSAAQMGATSSTIVDSAINAARTAGITGIGCDPGAVSAACLRSLPDPVIRIYLANAISTALPIMVPSVDGKVLPKSVKATFLAGENTKVPLVNGTNQDEYALYIAINEAGRRAAATPPNFDPANTSFALPAAGYAPTVAALTAGSGANVNDIVTKFYPLANFGTNPAIQPSLAASSMATDLGFSCPALRTSQRAAAQGSPVWMYEFRDQTALPTVGMANGSYYLSFPQGAAHSYDLQYLYNMGDLGNEERRQLQTAMTRYWTNFARTGNPNSGGEAPAAWPAFTGPDKVLGLDVASGGGIAQVSNFDAAHQCSAAWGSIVAF